MRTSAQKQEATQQTTPANSAIPGRGHFVQSPEAHSILQLQRTIVNQAVLRILQTNTEEPEARSTAGASPRFGHDFGWIPVHASAPAAIQPKLEVNTPGDIYEQEADHIADKVMRISEPELQAVCACGGGVPNQTGQPRQAHQRLLTK